MPAPEKFKLFNNTSALHKLKFRAGATNIYMKRDDTLDFAFGGNKVRLFEYVAGLAVERKAKKLITFGSIHSNHIRVAAAVANRLGIGCDLIVLTKEDQHLTDEGNFRLIGLHEKIKIMECPVNEAHDFIDRHLEAQEKSGELFLWIPGGAHMPEAAFGYVDAAQEIEEQLTAMNCPIDAIFLPTGTGTTQAGLLYSLNKKIPVFGVTIARSPERCKTEINSLIQKMHALTPRANIHGGGVVTVLSNGGIGYGLLTEEVKNVIHSLAKSDGIYLDPIYNAKAFYIMCRYLSEHDLKNVLYVNTGGTPNLFIQRSTD